MGSTVGRRGFIREAAVEDDLLAWWLNQMDEETNQTALDGDQGARFGATL